MALLLDAPLTSTFSGFDAAQSIGLTVDPRGLVAPIPSRIEINAAPDGSMAAMSRISPSDTLTFGGIRSEFDWAPEAAHAGGAAAERWYSWEVYLPLGFNPTEQISFMQIHDSPDGGESPVKFPNFELMAQDGVVYCMVPLNVPSELTSTGRVPMGYRVPLVTGRWVTCVLHTNWASGATGYLEAWYDGLLIAKEWSRACGYADAVGPYWKLGLYDFSHNGIAGVYSAWYRNAKVYSTGHGQQEILGAAPRTVASRLLLRSLN